MSLVLELEAGGRKAGRVCDREYRNGNNCPLLVRSTSEDVLTGDVFGILRRLPPRLWLKPMLAAAFPAHRFRRELFDQVHVSFWERLSPAPWRNKPEGPTEVDVTIRFGNVRLLLEAKYRSGLATHTANDPCRDQLIRLLDFAHADTRDQRLFPSAEETRVMVVGLHEREPKLVSAYRCPDAIRAALGTSARASELLSQRLSYLSWPQLARTLVASIARAGTVEQAFLADVVRFVRHRVERAKQDECAVEVGEPQEGDLPLLTRALVLHSGDAGPRGCEEQEHEG